MRPSVFNEDDGEVCFDFDASNSRTLVLSIGESGVGYSALVDGVSMFGRVKTVKPIPAEFLVALRKLVSE